MIAREPGIRLRDVAAACGITERTVQTIVSDLELGGYLTHVREGRRNRYQVTAGTRFRHEAEADHEVAGLLSLIIGEPRRDPEPNSERDANAYSTGTGTGNALRAAERSKRRSEPAGAR